jgi:hypothetical protein
MNDLFKQDFGLTDSFRLTPRLIHQAPWEEVEDTGELQLRAVRTHPAYDPRDGQNYFININLNPSVGFRSKPVLALQDIFAAGIKAFNLHLGREFLANNGAKTPSQVFEDAERIAGYQRYQIYKFAATFDNDVVFTERISQEQAKLMATHLAATMERHKDVPPPPPSTPTMGERIGRIFGM